MNELEPVERFVAQQTGLPLERVTRIVRLGEPWPFVETVGNLWSQSSSDATASSVPFETALSANVALVEMGAESLGPAAINRHIERTASLSGEEGETVRSVASALHKFFLLMIDQVLKTMKDR